MGRSQLGIWVSVRVNPPGKEGFAQQEGFNKRKINNNKTIYSTLFQAVHIIKIVLA